MNDENKLRIALRMNAFSCLSFGFIFAIWSEETAIFLTGLDEFSTSFLACGILLLWHGVHLIMGSLRKSMIKKEILYFCIGDFLWVVGTITCIALKYGITTKYGIIVSLVVATYVGTVGFVQRRLSNKLF